MLIIREKFTAKPGQASKLARLFKKVFSTDSRVRVMTDMIGDYNTVVMEMSVKNLAEYEEEMNRYKSGDMGPDIDAATKEEMSNYTEMYITGGREIYEIVD